MHPFELAASINYLVMGQRDDDVRCSVHKCVILLVRRLAAPSAWHMHLHMLDWTVNMFDDVSNQT